MSIEEINTWVDDRLRPGGTWIQASDVLEAIFYRMENIGPCYSHGFDRPTVSWDYVRVIEIVCEFLRDTNNSEALVSVLDRVLGNEWQKGITALKPSQKQRFATQMAWLLNVDAFRPLVAQYVRIHKGCMPDTDCIARTWDEARTEYKRVHGLGGAP